MQSDQIRYWFIKSWQAQLNGFLYSAQCKRRNANGATQVAQRKWQTLTLILNLLTLTHLRCAISSAPFELRRRRRVLFSLLACIVQPQSWSVGVG